MFTNIQTFRNSVTVFIVKEDLRFPRDVLPKALGGVSWREMFKMFYPGYHVEVLECYISSPTHIPTPRVSNKKSLFW